MNNASEITHLLEAWRDGDEAAKDQLFESMYEELRVVARAQRRKWHGKAPMRTTALVNELYLKLARQTRLNAKDRGHFNKLAGQAIRHILVDYARRRRRLIRGGGVEIVPLQDEDGALSIIDEQAEEILSIDQALKELAIYSERQAQVVELHFFAGLTYDEIGKTLGVAGKTAWRDWLKAKAWLHDELRGGGPKDTGPAPGEGRSLE